MSLLAFKQRPMETTPQTEQDKKQKAEADIFYGIRRALIKLLNRDYHVYEYLRDKQGKNDDCYPSFPTMLDDCAIEDRRTLDRILDRFSELGVITIIKSRGKVNRYRVTPPSPELLEELTKLLPPKKVGTKNVPASNVPSEKVGTKNDGTAGTKNAPTTTYKNCTSNDTHNNDTQLTKTTTTTPRARDKPKPLPKPIPKQETFLDFFEDPAVKIYESFFGTNQLDTSQMKILAKNVPKSEEGLESWTKACEYWVGNKYTIHHLSDLLDCWKSGNYLQSWNGGNPNDSRTNGRGNRLAERGGGTLSPRRRIPATPNGNHRGTTARVSEEEQAERAAFLARLRGDTSP